MTLSISGTDITVEAHVEVRNYLATVVGYNTTAISARSEVTKEATGLEVVLVFDNTGSMGSQSPLVHLERWQQMISSKSCLVRARPQIP